MEKCNEVSQIPQMFPQKWINEHIVGQEAELRKRGSSTVEQNGIDVHYKCTTSHYDSSVIKRPVKLIPKHSHTTVTTPMTMTTAVTTEAPTVSPILTVKSNRNRSLSESSVDELFKCGEATKQSGLNPRMWRNELLINTGSTRAQPKRKGSHCDSIDGTDPLDGINENCCCFGGGSKRNEISDATDVGVRVALVFIFIFLETMNSFKRKIHKEEMWLYMNPRTPDIVTPGVLLLSVIFGPLLVTLLHLWLTGDRRDFRAASWVWTLALGLNGLVTSTLKITVGRHRPDFFYRCFPDGIVVTNNASDPTGNVDLYNCTGNIYDIQEGRKSFPSGHSSFAFVGFGFIAIYVGAKLHALSSRGRGQSWRLFVTIMPLIVAALIAVSRTCDYHHHWEDVVMGGFIGLFITYLVYRQYYPSIFSRRCDRPYLRNCMGHVDQRNYRRSGRSAYQSSSSKTRISECKGFHTSKEIYEDKAFKDEYETSSKDECRPLIYDG